MHLNRLEKRTLICNPKHRWVVPFNFNRLIVFLFKCVTEVPLHRKGLQVQLLEEKMGMLQ